MLDKTVIIISAVFAILNLGAAVFNMFVGNYIIASFNMWIAIMFGLATYVTYKETWND